MWKYSTKDLSYDFLLTHSLATSFATHSRTTITEVRSVCGRNLCLHTLMHTLELQSQLQKQQKITTKKEFN